MRSMVEGYVRVILTWPARGRITCPCPSTILCEDGPPPRFGEDYRVAL